ncbi:MAG: metal-sensing transcriptional repressor [Lachnospiraceae bacterium]|nr:metal-sensing transcriptional repressor [Lachnospiraceae bacterium]
MKELDAIVSKEEEKVASCPNCSNRHKKRSEEQEKALLVRLKKIEGQIRGVEKMVEDDRYCPDILMQVSAITSALNSFNKELLACHIRSCVASDIQAGKDESIEELCNVLQKLMK